MKNYNVKIKEEGHERNLEVSVDTKEEFIKWVELLASFEKKDQISFEEIRDKDSEAEKVF